MSLSYSWEEWAVLAGGRLEKSGTVRPARVAIDSRAVQPGDLFVALKGERVDGHDFLKAAADRGAAGALVSRAGEGLPDGFGVIRVDDPLAALQKAAAAHRQKMNVRVVGITGSNGKTTTKEMLAHVLRESGRAVCATRGNLNSQIGLPLMLLDLSADHTHAVLEMGASAKGDLTALASMARPAMVVLTGIGRAHLETFSSPEGVLSAKWELVDSLGPDGIAFLNGDDPRLMKKKSDAHCSVVTFGTGCGLDVRAERIRQEPRAVFDLVVGGARREVRLPVSGLFNVGNALAAAAVALWERVPLPEVVRSLGTFTPPAQRMQVRVRSDGALFMIDAYNANPDSMGASLNSFVNAYPGAPKVVVLGSMLELGGASEEEHRQLGRLLAGLPIDKFFFVGPEGAWVRSGYEAAGGKKFFTMGNDRAVLTDEIARSLRPESVALFKASRGVRLEDIYEALLNGKRTP